MKEEFVNPFLVPAKLVWEKELKQTLELESAELVSHQFTTEDITAVIGVSGQLQGNVLYGFSMETAKSLISTMLGDGVDASDGIALSALGEIANMITGNAATNLAEQGYRCSISPPVMLEPMGSRISTLGGSQILVTFTSAVGPLHIRISLHRTPD